MLNYRTPKKAIGLTDKEKVLKINDNLVNRFFQRNNKFQKTVG